MFFYQVFYFLRFCKQGVSKDVPNLKSLLNSIFCNIIDSNSNQRLIWDFRCAFKSILFSYVEFRKQGRSSKCLIFKWLAQKNFNLKLGYLFIKVICQGNQPLNLKRIYVTVPFLASYILKCCLATNDIF